MTERQSEAERLQLITRLERPYWESGAHVAGMDEVGRGPLAGPVVAACVIMPPEPLLERVNDSKKLSPKTRERLAQAIIDIATDYSIAFVGHEVIDAENILNATRQAFNDAFAGMRIHAPNVLTDYITGISVPGNVQTFKHGDSLSYSIAAASILAKVERDRYMVQMHEKYPQYGFNRNMGYGTAEHMAALREFGPCPIHRRTFLNGVLRTINNGGPM